MKTFQVKVQPNSRVSSLEPRHGAMWIARVKSPPVDGKANKELLALLADHFDCRKADVSIKAGATSQIKLVQINSG
jgi:uncharacterized protein